MSPWQILGLEPGASASEIRRAYAVLLKRTRPEDDPDGFRALRSAYEAALALSAQRPALAPTPPVDAAADSAAPDTAAGTSIEPPAPSAPQPLDPAAQDAIRTVLAALERGDSDRAAAALARAIDHNLLPIAAEIGLGERLLATLTADRSVPADRMQAIALQFGWYGASDVLQSRHGMAQHRLRARIDAENWLKALRVRANDWRFWVGNQEATAARLLLGRGPLLLSWLLPPEPPLSILMIHLAKHHPWIQAQFSDKRLTLLQKLTARKGWAAKPKYAAWSLLGLGGLLTLITTGVTPIWTVLPLAGISRRPGLVRSMVLLALVMFLFVEVNAATGWIGLPDAASTRRWVSVPSLAPQPKASFDPIADLRQKAEAGQPAAIDQLALAYLNGGGVLQDDAEALRWFRRGADLGDSIAQFNLGVMNLLGRGGAQDYAEARRLFSLCQDKQDSCNVELAWMHYNGLGGARNYAEARRLYQIAATRGVPLAQTILGFMYEKGQGGDADPMQAFKWTKLAAIQKFPSAMANLGQYYSVGFGVPGDKIKALAWLTAAAEAGEPWAMYHVAEFKKAKPRTRSDDLASYRWYSLASRHVPDVPVSAEEINAALARVAKRLTPGDRAKIDAELASWQPHPPDVLPETDAPKNF